MVRADRQRQGIARALLEPVRQKVNALSRLLSLLRPTDAPPHMRHLRWARTSPARLRGPATYVQLMSCRQFHCLACTCRLLSTRDSGSKHEGSARWLLRGTHGLYTCSSCHREICDHTLWIYRWPTIIFTVEDTHVIPRTRELQKRAWGMGGILSRIRR